MSALLRSAKFLRIVSGFAKNFTVGSVRNDAENFLENHRHQWQGIDARFLSTQLSSVPQPVDSSGLHTLDKALQKLDFDIQRTGRIAQRDVEGIYEEVKVTGSISSSQSLLLIRCCGNLVAEELPEQRTHLAQNIWQTLQSIGVPMDISHYNALLRVYLENEHQFSPSDFLSYLKTQEVEPNRVTYQRLISRFCLLGDIEGATRILEHMKENKLAINEHVFNSLVVGHARANDLESAQAMISMMKRAHLEPSGETFRHLACAYAQQSDMEGVRQTLEQAEREEVQLQNRDLLEIVYSLTMAGNQLHLDELLPRLHRSAGFNQDLVTVILRLVNAGHEDVAFTLLKIMLPPQESPNEPIGVGNFFIRQMVRARRPVEVTLQYCAQMRESGMNQKAVLVALHKALELGELPTAERLLRALPEHGFSVRPHYFWPLIVAAKRASNLPGLLQVLELMRQLDCPVGSETLTEQVLPGLDRTANWDNVLAKLHAVGVRYRVTAPALCRHLLATDKLQLATAVADRYSVLYSPAVLRRPLADAYARSGDTAVVQLLHHMCQSAPDLNLTAQDVAAGFLQELVPLLHTDRAAAVEKLLQAMLERGLAISDGCAEAVQTQLGDACTDRCCHLLDQLSQSELAPSGPPADFAVTHVRGDRDAAGSWSQSRRPGHLQGTRRNVQLEAEIAAAQAAGEPLAPLLTNYFNLMLAMKRLDRALEDLLELGEEHMTPSMMAGLCNGLIEAERLDEALQVYHQMLASFPDAHNDWRVLLLARLMVMQGRSEEAVAFLHSQPRDTRQAAARERSHNFFMAAWRLLNVPAERGDPELVRRLLNVLMDDNYVTEPKRALLAMLVKAHIAKEDLVGATDELERIFKEYRQLPWKSQLMISLIQQENPDQLQRVVDLSMAAYGEMSSLYDLAFSFIECGKTRQAKKVLETPGLRARHERLDQTCARYADNGRVTELEDLVTVTRDVVGVERLPMYGHLLRALCAAERPDRALAVWSQMQEESLAPTEDMMCDLAALLRRHARPVPFVVPEDGRPQVRRMCRSLLPAPPPPPPPPPPAFSPRPPPTRFTPSVPAPLLAEPPPNSIKSKLKRAIKAQDIDQALAHRKQMEQELVEPAIHDLSLLVELLVRADRMREAVDITSDMLGRSTFPQPRVFKFLMSRLSADGDVDSISAIGAQLSDELKSATSYDNRLCTAYLNAGRGEEYLDQLEETCRGHTSGAGNNYVFPAGGFLGMLHGLPDLYPRCVKLAEEFAARDVMTPINMIWVNHFVNERYDEAQAIFDKYLHNRDIVLFRGVIEKADETNNLEMTTRLYEMLRPTPISRGAKAVLVSAVIQISMTQTTLTDTILTLRESGFAAEDLKKTVAEQLQREAAASGLLLPRASHTEPRAPAATDEADAVASEADAAASQAAPGTSPASQPPPGLPLA